MDYTVFVELIGSVGLPIALVIAMGAFIYKIYKKSEEREDALRTEIKENQAINSKAVTTLALYAERLGVIEQDVQEIKSSINIIANNQENSL